MKLFVCFSFIVGQVFIVSCVLKYII